MIKNLIIFIGGVAVGTIGSYIYFQKKYTTVYEPATEKDNEVEDVTFDFESDDSIENVAEKARNKKDISEYAKKLKEEDYIDYAGISASKIKSKEVVEEEREELEKPRFEIISEENYLNLRDNCEFVDEQLVCYSDNYITNWRGGVVSPDIIGGNVNTIIFARGSDPDGNIDEKYDDSVYVVDNVEEKVFEIVFDESELYSDSPEDE